MNGCTAWFRSRILIQRSAASSLQEAQALGMWTDLPRSAHPTLTWQTAGAFQPAVDLLTSVQLRRPACPGRHRRPQTSRTVTA